jgi:hypothetical protein
MREWVRRSGRPTGCATQAVADQAGGARRKMHQGANVAAVDSHADQRLLLFFGRQEAAGAH